jgi:hypothetical protein
LRPLTKTRAPWTNVATESAPPPRPTQPQVDPVPLPVDPVYTTQAAEPTETSVEAVPTPQTEDMNAGVPIVIQTAPSDPTPTDEPFEIQTALHNPPSEETGTVEEPTATVEIQPTEEVEWVYEDELDGPEAAEADNGKAVAALFAELVLYLRDLTPAATLTKPQSQQLPTKTVPAEQIMQTESLPWAAGIEVEAAATSLNTRETIAWIEVAPQQMWT